MKLIIEYFEFDENLNERLSKSDKNIFKISFKNFLIWYHQFLGTSRWSNN
jgi:hypothetical protein